MNRQMSITMRTKLATIGLALALNFAVVNAQPQPSRDPLQDIFIPPELVLQHRVDLGLTDQQKQAILSRLDKLRPELEKGQQALQQKVQSMQQLLQDAKLEHPKLVEQFQTILEQENQMKQLQFGMMLLIRETLSPEQRAKAHKLKQNWPQERQDLERRLRSKVEKIEAGMQDLVASGVDPSEIATIMQQQVQPLMNEGNLLEAEAAMDSALKLIQEKNKK
jgi:Spy/CpxP family protein refolding chaperone